MARFYITYYEEYPIFEPAEGGYYYTGREVVPLEDNEYDDFVTAFDEAKAFISEYLGDEWRTFNYTADESLEMMAQRVMECGEDEGRILMAYLPSKYIGEGAQLYIETPQAYQGKVSGWHPYE